MIVIDALARLWILGIMSTERNESPAVSIAQAAVFLGVSESGIRNAVRRGDLRAVRFGKRVLVSRESLESVMKETHR
jgi:excisionase family DNA binding protein